MKKNSLSEGKKIFLVINTGYFGDVLLTSKLTRDIKKEYPDSFLVFVPDSPYEALVQGLPGVDEVICYDRKKCQNIFEFIKFVINFPYKFKIAATFLPNGRKTNRLFLAKILGSKKILMLLKFKQTEELGKIAALNPLNGRFSYAVANMLSTFTGKLTDDKDIQYIIPDIAKEKVKNYLKEINLQSDLVAINPQAGDDWKCWDVDELIKFVKLVMNDGKKVVLTGVSKDGSQYVKAMDEQIGAENYINMIDKTSIPELGALYEKCKAVISVDTGSMHMACAVGTPTIALFFREQYSYWAPLNIEKNPYIYNPEGIKAEVVYEELKKIVNNDCPVIQAK